MIRAFFLKHIIVALTFIFLKNWFNEYHNIMQSQSFFMGKESQESTLAFK